jgi:hypothetical protein
VAEASFLVKLAATPLLIAFVYAVERRFGHAVAGLVFGFPLTSALATSFLAAEQGAAFARATVPGLLAGIATLAVFLLAYARAAARWRSWPAALAAALACYAPVAVGLAWWGPDFAASIAVGVLALAAAVALMPRGLGPAPHRPHGRWELPLRAAIGTGLVVGLTAVARDLGPVGTGILLLFPAVTSTLSSFVLGRAGPAAVVRMLRSMAWGCFAFVAFFVVAGVSLGTMPTAVALVLAGLAAVGAGGITWRLGVSRLAAESPKEATDYSV